MIRIYSNFSLPAPNRDEKQASDQTVTLVAQAQGLSSLLPAADAEPAQRAWRSTLPFQAEVVRLYQDGRSLTSIEKEVGIAWDSVARLLDRAGVRERKNKGR